ncbi:MAG TPA: cytochrome c oxidase assembly protein [Phenylobacterium sp.]|nr:cytochrome c oxidase assembly protein [Phenylobacterium sp.]
MAFVYSLGGSGTYCGAPPQPEQLWSRWNLDPRLIAVLLLILAVYLVGVELRPAARQRPSLWRRLCFYGGWSLASLALISPLCALSVSLAAARVGQHMILTVLAAPLVALGLPRRPTPGFAGASIAAAAVFGAILWFWQSPGPYEATFQSPAIYWAMHLTAFGAALALCWLVLAGGPARLAETLAAAAITSLQMGLLGAILTFTDHPLYAPHLLTTQAWGLTPLADQQLAGAIMWIPAGVLMTAAVVAGLALTLQGAERRALRVSAP